MCSVRRAGPKSRALCLQVKAHTSVIPSLSYIFKLPLPTGLFFSLKKMPEFLASEGENPIVKTLHPFLVTGLLPSPFS